MHKYNVFFWGKYNVYLIAKKNSFFREKNRGPIQLPNSPTRATHLHINPTLTDSRAASRRRRLCQAVVQCSCILAPCFLLRWSSQAAVHGSLPKMLSRSPSHLALHILSPFLDRSDPPCSTAAPILPRYRIGGVLRSIEINCIYLFFWYFPDTVSEAYREVSVSDTYHDTGTAVERRIGGLENGGKSFLGQGCLDSPHHTNEDSRWWHKVTKMYSSSGVVGFKAFLCLWRARQYTRT
jgi:hypothetical protein